WEFGWVPSRTCPDDLRTCPDNLNLGVLVWIEVEPVGCASYERVGGAVPREAVFDVVTGRFAVAAVDQHREGAVLVAEEAASVDGERGVIPYVLGQVVRYIYHFGDGPAPRQFRERRVVNAV